MLFTNTRISIFIFCFLCSLFSARSLSVSPRPRIPVLKYDDNFVCVNKPAGITMSPNKINRKRFTLTSTVKKQLARKVFPVHRLDHRTSGALLFAFDANTCGKLQEKLSQGTKEYIALLRGPWKHVNEMVLVTTPLRDIKTNVTKSAVSKFTRLASQANATLVLCEIETGRYHQIRRHAARSLGQPVIGDTQHGDTSVNRWFRQHCGLNRLALHSLSIQLDKDQVMVAPLSPELKKVFENEPLWKQAVVKEPRLLLEPVDVRGGTHGRHYRKRKERMEQAFQAYDAGSYAKSSLVNNTLRIMCGHEHHHSANPTLTEIATSTSSSTSVKNKVREKRFHWKSPLVPWFGSLKSSNLMYFSNLALKLLALRLLVPWRLVTLWTVVPGLALYAAAEAVFWALFHFHILPTCNIPAEPQDYRGYGKQRHLFMLRILQRIERTCRATDTPFLPAFTCYINEWFHNDGLKCGDTLEMPRKENMDELFAYAFFGKFPTQLEPWMKTELQLIYDMLESRYNVTFTPGINSNLRPMRLSLDPLEPSYRPLLIYLLFGSVQLCANLFLRLAGFRFYTTSNGLRYWYRSQKNTLQRQSSQKLNARGRAEPTNAASQLPLLFFHGIAPGGVALYLPMLLYGLGKGGRPVMLFENPAISFQLCLRAHTEQETVAGVWQAVNARLGPKTGVSIVGHSFGSCQLTWLLHSDNAVRIQQVVLVDPVSVLLTEPDVLTNFLYGRKAHQEKSRAIGVVANELFIENYLRRSFAWYNSELWLEDIPPHCKVVVCLAAKDDVLNAKKIKREIDIHMSEKGVEMDLILWENGSHAYCVTRPDAWKQLSLKMRQQEYLIAKEARLVCQ